MNFEWKLGVLAICCATFACVLAGHVKKHRLAEIEKFKDGRQQTNEIFLKELGSIDVTGGP